MNPQQFQQQVVNQYNQRAPSALAQAFGQVTSGGTVGGGGQPMSQQAQPSQIQQMLHGIGYFLHNIGHPIAQQFNQMHGFNFGQPQKQPTPQQPR